MFFFLLLGMGLFLLMLFKTANWFVFVMSIGFFVMVMTNFIMNVAAITIHRNLPFRVPTPFSKRESEVPQILYSEQLGLK